MINFSNKNSLILLGAESPETGFYNRYRVTHRHLQSTSLQQLCTSVSKLLDIILASGH